MSGDHIRKKSLKKLFVRFYRLMLISVTSLTVILHILPSYEFPLWLIMDMNLQLATEESKNFRERNMSIVLVPNKALLQKGQDPPKKPDKSSANEVSASI